MKPAGFIFDLDGTLGDTLPVCFQAFRHTLEIHLGKTYTDLEIRAMFGPSEEGVFQRLLPDRWEECLATFLEAYERAHQEMETVFPEMAEVLDALQCLGLRLAIVTGKGPGSAAISLRHLGLAPYFEVMEAGSPAGGVKAEAIGRVLGRWGFSSGQVVYVGDTVSDMRAARQAGVLAVGAAWGRRSAPKAELKEHEPLAVFERVPEFLAWIRSGLGSGSGG
jgi:HAD superfamily hydrolase (TIGR01549 family)